MELLLWMWLYDQRFFFNYKLSIRFFKLAWLFPLIMHLTLATACVYFVQVKDVPNCESTLKLWLYSRILFSYLISLIIVVFMCKISAVRNKERHFFDNATQIYPLVNDTLNRYDYWIRRRSIISLPGIMLFFLGLISLFWSYVIIKLYYFDNQFRHCNQNVLTLLNINSIIIFTCNIPIGIVLLSLIFIKLGSVACAFVCPGFLIFISQCCEKKRRLNIKKHRVSISLKNS
jgi:hypothetical protein